MSAQFTRCDTCCLVRATIAHPTCWWCVERAKRLASMEYIYDPQTDSDIEDRPKAVGEAVA